MGVLRLSFELDEFLECPEGYLSISTARGTGDAGVPIPPHQWFHWLEFDEAGKMVRAQLFLDRGAAFTAAEPFGPDLLNAE